MSNDQQGETPSTERFQLLLFKQPLSVVDAAVSAGKFALKGAVCGAVCGFLFKKSIYPKGPLIEAGKFAATWGVGEGIIYVMKTTRGKIDAQTGLAGGFGFGVTQALLGGKRGLYQVTVHGLVCGLATGALFQYLEIKDKERREDLFYAKTQCILSSLGLQQYEKNFKMGLLTDRTLPYLTDSDLQEVNIPPAPRLLILNQIKRVFEMLEKLKDDQKDEPV